jgi:hypothetical protein
MINRHPIDQSILRAVVVLLALASLAACGTTAQSPAVVCEPTIAVVVSPVALAEPTARLAPTGVPLATDVSLPTAAPLAAVTPTLHADPLRYGRVDITEAGLSFEVPVSWQQLDGVWAWSGDGAEWPRVEVLWRELPPPLEAEAAMLPSPATILESKPVTLEWGEGRRVTIEIYGSQPLSNDARAPLLAVETHVIVVVPRGGSRDAYDFAARARTAEELAGPRLVLQQMLDSSQLLS